MTAAARILQQFCSRYLTRFLSEIEASAIGLTSTDCSAALATYVAREEVLAAAGQVKKLAGQINVTFSLWVRGEFPLEAGG